MWSLLRTRRWIGFTITVIVAILAFGLLSAWQWSRAEDRQREEQALQASLSTSPVDVGALTASPELPDWLPVAATGEFDDEQTTLVRKRPLDSRNGFWVMTPLRTSTGTLWVNRGWIPASADALATPDLPAAPTGQVAVTGNLRPFSPVRPEGADGLPPGQVTDPDLAQLPDVEALTIGYLQVGRSEPPDAAVRVLPLPQIDAGRNISYAVQWALFALVAIAGWFFFLRREANEDRRLRTQDSRSPESRSPESLSDQEQPWTST